MRQDDIAEQDAQAYQRREGVKNRNAGAQRIAMEQNLQDLGQKKEKQNEKRNPSLAGSASSLPDPH